MNSVIAMAKATTRRMYAAIPRPYAASYTSYATALCSVSSWECHRHSSTKWGSLPARILSSLRME